jgi:phytoene dehydrogenase-like protein
MDNVTIVGAGVAGLTAAIASAEAGAPVVLYDASKDPGGRARTLAGPYRANLGPHALYNDGPMWAWLKDHSLLPPIARFPFTGARLRWNGELHRTPPFAMIPAMLRMRGRRAPVDESFREWVTRQTDEDTAQFLCNGPGVYTFHHDPGELSAAFIWERTVRLVLTMPPSARYIRGGWGSLVDSLYARVKELGVECRFGERVTELTGGVVIVAVEPEQARALLGDDSLRVPSGRTVCADLALTRRRGDPFTVSDLDEAGWVERYTAADPTLAPEGQELVQAQMPIRPGETADEAAVRLDALLDVSLPDRAARTLWHRRLVMEGRTGALDLPGSTWRDRPAIERGDGVFLAGDWTAAPGLLSEVAWASGVAAAAGAVQAAQTARPSLRRVA